MIWVDLNPSSSKPLFIIASYFEASRRNGDLDLLVSNRKTGSPSQKRTFFPLLMPFLPKLLNPPKRSLYCFKWDLLDQEVLFLYLSSGSDTWGENFHCFYELLLIPFSSNPFLCVQSHRLGLSSYGKAQFFTNIDLCSKWDFRIMRFSSLFRVTFSFLLETTF